MKLKLWNGRAMSVLDQEFWKGHHLYIAAYSVADARRVCVESGFKDPGSYEIKTYWNAGLWGNSMDGIPIERGLWIGADNETPQRAEEWSKRTPKRRGKK